jgi:hypothetical protein
MNKYHIAKGDNLNELIESVNQFINSIASPVGFIGGPILLEGVYIQALEYKWR